MLRTYMYVLVGADGNADCKSARHVVYGRQTDQMHEIDSID